jgi:hypothetical protein
MRQAFHISDEIHLDEQNAIGRAGDISWDLNWEDSGRRFSYMPHVLEKIGLAKSTYDDCLLDLRATGTIRCGDTEVEVDGAPAMVGHIHVERKSQKGIVIGKGGKRLKAIGKASRERMQSFFHRKVFLETFVRIESEWSEDPNALQRFGYE